MTVNQKGNILEFNKAEIILIQGFCRLKCPHPTVFLIPLKFSELSVPLYSASRIQVYYSKAGFIREIKVINKQFQMAVGL